MSSINKKYVDLSGLGILKTQISALIDSKISAIANFVGATSSTDGVAGKVPAPQAGDQNKYLKANGSWSTIDNIFVGTQAEWTLDTNKSSYTLVVITDD